MFEARLEGERLVGQVTYPDGKVHHFEGKKAPLLLDKRAPVWGEPVTLFDGKTLAGWKLRDTTKKNGWAVVNGELAVVEPKDNADLVTEQVFQDLKLHIEFNVDAKSNSGVYLRGRYEIQILDNPDAKMALDSHGCGGLYSRVAPKLDATKPAGEWQTYDITFVGRQLTGRAERPGDREHDRGRHHGRGAQPLRGRAGAADAAGRPRQGALPEHRGDAGAVSLSKQIFVALAGGVALGLFFGEKVAFLSIGGRAFIQLLQITVLPYVAGSLIYGFGSLGSKQARLVFTRGGALLLLLWAMTLGLVFLAPLALPAGKGGAFFSAAPQDAEHPIDWVNLYIPSNPFYALANNVVPAVVVFAVLAGIALMGMKDKDALLRPLAVFNAAMGRVGTMVAKTTPFGIFAIAAHTAATMRLEEFERLQGFLLLYAGFACLLTFWLLPGLVAATTHVGHRRLVAAVAGRARHGLRDLEPVHRPAAARRALARAAGRGAARATRPRRSSSTCWCPPRSTSPTRPSC